jgi:hypothetical protein
MFHLLGRFEDCRLASTELALVSSLTPAEVLLAVTDKKQTFVSRSYLPIARRTAEWAVTYTRLQFTVYLVFCDTLIEIFFSYPPPSPYPTL